jgi:hypothetical protein
LMNDGDEPRVFDTRSTFSVISRSRDTSR